MNKNSNINDSIDYVATDCDGGIVSITPRLFIESLCMAASCNETELWKRLNNEPLKSKYDVMSLVTEERLPSEIEFTRIARALKVRKLEVVKCFEIIVKTLPNDTNKLNFQFTWPKNWGENVEEIGEAICEIFRSGDFKNNSLFCNYTTIHNMVTIAADSGKFESAKSFGSLIEALRTVINYIYINSPFDASVNELDEPIYKLVDDAVYSTLHEVAVNGVEEGVDLAPLQKYLYQKGVVDLPNVNDDKVTTKAEDNKCYDEPTEPSNQAKKYEKAKMAMMEKVKAYNDSFKPIALEPIRINRPYVMINASNVDNSAIRAIAESFNGNVDICIEAIDVGNIK